MSSKSKGMIIKLSLFHPCIQVINFTIAALTGNGAGDKQGYFPPKEVKEDEIPKVIFCNASVLHRIKTK